MATNSPCMRWCATARSILKAAGWTAGSASLKAWRVLAGNSVGTLAIMLLAVVGFLTGRPEFLDIGLTYGLLNLIGTLSVLKFFRHGDLAYDADSEPNP